MILSLTDYIPGVPASFGQEFSKKSQKFPPNLSFIAAFHTLIVL